MTKRQAEANDWLKTVGKATATTLRRHGFSAATMEYLVEEGHVTREVRGSGPGTYVIYLPKEER